MCFCYEFWLHLSGAAVSVLQNNAKFLLERNIHKRKPPQENIRYFTSLNNYLDFLWESFIIDTQLLEFNQIRELFHFHLH